MNINEIAELSGVSRTTVSRYLNDGYVSAEKREKIRAVVEQTGYVPSNYAQTLRTNKTGVVGIIVPKISSESISRMTDGLTEVLGERGYHTLLGNAGSRLERELDYLTVFRNRQVDGIVLIGTVLTAAHIKAIRALPMPIVVLGQQTEVCGCVYYDDFGAAKALTEKLLDHGRRRIGFIGVDHRDMAAGLARFEGYQAALKKAGLQPEKNLLTQGAFALESGYENTGILLDRVQGLDALFCATDNIAAGAIMRLRERGVSSPEQVAVCGVGDSPVARLLYPSLTSAHLHYKTGGEEAARMLLALMDNEVPMAVHKSVKLGCTVIERKSTGE